MKRLDGISTVVEAALAAAILLGGAAPPVGASAALTVPPDQRGDPAMERTGMHSAGNIRTLFWNYGMIGDYPADPGNVDLSVFHSVEAPLGSGMNYSDGITPFILSRVLQSDGSVAYIMETGFRERQGISPYTNRIMRFEPRPGYFQMDPAINLGISLALSNDPRTWPPYWPDRLDDPADPGWPGHWNGFFGKRAVATQESFMVLDDQAYDAWPLFVPDQSDPTRRGLALRIEVRSLQWSQALARDVIFWHYDITNEGTTDYNDNLIFGVYMDPGVGGSSLSCDGTYESDDDKAYYETSSGFNLGYAWDLLGHGVDLSGPCGSTGYVGCSFLETPGQPTDALDNDLDGITDEKRDGGAGELIVGQNAIRAYVDSHYDMDRFQAAYGPLENHAPYRLGTWWTGDEDMDWNQELQDLGADGVPETGDTGEGDGIPTEGEANFDRTDINESDQIGLTGFKLNRIRPGMGNPDPTVDNIVFYTDSSNWPQRLWDHFTASNPADRFDPPLTGLWNIGFLLASGSFRLAAGQTTRFSLALAYAPDLAGLRQTVRIAQSIQESNYQPVTAVAFSDMSVEAGRDYVDLHWSVFLDTPARLFVLRSTAEDGAYEPISGALEGKTGRSDFIYRDTSVGSSTEHYYKIGCEEAGHWSYSSAVRAVMPAGVFAFLGTSPNPSRGGGQRLMFELSRTGRARLDVYDVAGRRLRTVVDQVFAPGVRTVEWDGCGEDGRLLPAGVYCARVEFEGKVATGKIVVAR